MHFYNINYIKDINKDCIFPCLGFIKDNWNDYGANTLFHVFHFFTQSNYEELGYYRIMHNGDKSTELLPSFEELDEDWCSLAMSDDFYSKFYLRDKTNIEEALYKLNDISLKPKYFEIFKNNEVFNNSILRGSSINFIKQNFHLIIEGDSPVYNQNFKYTCSIGNEENKVTTNFTFIPLDKDLPEIPYRINCLIGKNATGKTTILSKLAISLCGKNDDITKLQFPNGRPHFNKIIAISFSIFDSFEHPNPSNTGEDSNVDKNYFYCGYQNEKGNLTTEKQRIELLNKSWKTIHTDPVLTDELQYLLKMFLNEALLSNINNFKISNKENFENLYFYIKENFSSGQFMMFYFVTNTLANIVEHSLILFDEPELNLHPNGISIIIKVLNELLRKRDSYAIIATHSPIIVQQIPKKYISILQRLDETTYITEPDIETFGENLSAITRNIFDNIDNDSFYKTVLRNESKYISKEYIKKVFDYNLSINASLFLENLENGKL